MLSGGLVLWGQKFWKNIPQARHMSLEVFQLEGSCRFQVLLGSGEVGRVGTTGVWRVDDIGVYLNGGIQPKFRFDPVHGQIVLERTSKSQPEVAAQKCCLGSSRRHSTFTPSPRLVTHWSRVDKLEQQKPYEQYDGGGYDFEAVASPEHTDESPNG